MEQCEHCLVTTLTEGAMAEHRRWCVLALRAEVERLRERLAEIASFERLRIGDAHEEMTSRLLAARIARQCLEEGR